MKRLLLAISLCTAGTFFYNSADAQAQNKSKYDEQWPPLVVLRAAEQAVAGSSDFPVGTYDYYYFSFTFSKGLWITSVEYYDYEKEPTSLVGIEVLYFKNNGTQVMNLQKP